MGFFITLCYILLFHDINLTVSPLDRLITVEFRKGVFHEDVTYQHPSFVNNSNNNHYFTNYSTNNSSVATNEQLNSETNDSIIELVMEISH